MGTPEMPSLGAGGEGRLQLRAEEAARERIEQILRRLTRPDGEAEQTTLEGELTRQEAKLESIRAERAERSRKPGAVSTAQTLGKTTTGLSAEATLRMPYVPTGVAHLLGLSSPTGDARPLVTVTVEQAAPGQGPNLMPGAPGMGAPRRLRVEVMVEGYSAREIQTLETNAPKSTFDLTPSFFGERLRTVTETTRAALQIRVSQHQGEKEIVEIEQSMPVWLLARNAACLSMMDPGTGDWADYSYGLGAWVTPNESSILDLVSAAAGKKEGGFFGRQNPTDAAIEAQVRGLYEAVAFLGFRYVDFVTTIPRRDGRFYQRVRLPAESLALRAGNCIDGVLLFASLLEAASLEPAIVVLEGHAIVAWKRANAAGEADKPDQWLYLDTTYLGRGDFATARREGQREGEVQSKIAQLKDKREYFRLWPLSDLRLKGIIPLA